MLSGDRCFSHVGTSSPELTSNLRNFETERGMSEKHEIKLLHLQEVHQCNSCFFVVSSFVPKFRCFYRFGAVNTFLTARTSSGR